jgi:hypothetical protein
VPTWLESKRVAFEELHARLPDDELDGALSEPRRVVQRTEAKPELLLIVRRPQQAVEDPLPTWHAPPVPS